MRWMSFDWIRNNLRLTAGLVSPFIWPGILSIVTVVLCWWVVQFVIWPGYKDPQSRLFTSSLGYATVLRQQGKPFPVTTSVVQSRTVTARFLGEGTMQSEPFQVPIIAMSRIERVHVAQGDVVAKGQLLVELDSSRLRIKINAARAQIQTASAELERTKIGSAYVLEKERPEREQIRLSAIQSEVGFREELDELYDQLESKGVMSKKETLLRRIENAKVIAKLKEATLALDVAESGRQQSLEIAIAAVRDAELALEYREHELRDYKVYATASGVIERCLVHEDEYNQDPGKPAFVIASGLWFEAYLDQTAIGQFGQGVSAEVRLEAFPGRVFSGTVREVLPIVSYSLGGPETNRPIRPLGTGAPEWPATFKIRIDLDAHESNVVPGLTGFARITVSKKANAVPRGAVSCLSGNSGMVFVVEGEHVRPVQVKVGWKSADWIQVFDGVEPGMVVVADGHQVLEPGDRIIATKEFVSSNGDENE